MSDFWARRKRAVEAEAVAEAAARDATAVAEARAEIADLPEAEALERLGLPDPDTIGPGDDVTAFMAKAVPAYLRNRALRRLWTSNPVLANLDGLADYAEDYTGNGLNGGVVQTSYEVGKGLAAHVRKIAEAVEEPPIAEGDNKVNPSEMESRPNDAVDEINLAAPSDGVTRSPGIPSHSDRDEGGRREDAARRPRMRFSFEEDDRDERCAAGGSERTG